MLALRHHRAFRCHFASADIWRWGATICIAPFSSRPVSASHTDPNDPADASDTSDEEAEVAKALLHSSPGTRLPTSVPARPPSPVSLRRTATPAGSPGPRHQEHAPPGTDPHHEASNDSVVPRPRKLPSKTSTPRASMTSVILDSPTSSSEGWGRSSRRANVTADHTAPTSLSKLRTLTKQKEKDSALRASGRSTLSPSVRRIETSTGPVGRSRPGTPAGARVAEDHQSEQDNPKEAPVAPIVDVGGNRQTSDPTAPHTPISKMTKDQQKPVGPASHIVEPRPSSSHTPKSPARTIPQVIVPVLPSPAKSADGHARPAKPIPKASRVIEILSSDDEDEQSDRRDQGGRQPDSAGEAPPSASHLPIQGKEQGLAGFAAMPANAPADNHGLTDSDGRSKQSTSIRSQGRAGALQGADRLEVPRDDSPGSLPVAGSARPPLIPPAAPTAPFQPVPEGTSQASEPDLDSQGPTMDVSVNTTQLLSPVLPHVPQQEAASEAVQPSGPRSQEAAGTASTPAEVTGMQAGVAEKPKEVSQGAAAEGARPPQPPAGIAGEVAKSTTQRDNTPVTSATLTLRELVAEAEDKWDPTFERLEQLFWYRKLRRIPSEKKDERSHAMLAEQSYYLGATTNKQMSRGFSSMRNRRRRNRQPVVAPGQKRTTVLATRPASTSSPTGEIHAFEVRNEEVR